MISGRVQLYPSMVEANTAACLKRLGDMVQQVCTSLSQEGSSMGESYVSASALSADLCLLSNSVHTLMVFTGGVNNVEGLPCCTGLASPVHATGHKCTMMSSVRLLQV